MVALITKMIFLAAAPFHQAAALVLKSTGAPMQWEGEHTVHELYDNGTIEQLQKEHITSLTTFQSSLEDMGLATQQPIINIDIGTLGSLDGMLKEGELLITFDPWDKETKEKGFERWPYIVGDVDGQQEFIFNHVFPACSSSNPTNPLTASALRNSSACEVPSGGAWDAFQKCVDQSNITKEKVDAIKLSTFLRQRNVSEIGFLKIDAQGSDSAIVRDVMETFPTMNIRRIQLECQKYDEAGARQIYAVDNDCSRITAYVMGKHPEYSVSESFNNCEISEYNLLFEKQA